MHIGTCKIQLFLPGIQGLKAKRRILKSLKDQLRHQFNIAFAEIDDQDTWQRATIGIVCISNDTQRIDQTIELCLQKIKNQIGRVQIITCNKEIMSSF